MLSVRISALLSLLDTMPTSPALRRVESSLIRARIDAERMERDERAARATPAPRDDGELPG
jgi:hypothetical protein